jgi:predicted MFS family arabinose efflux permease
MRAITTTPGLRRLFGTSVFARLPLTMLSIGLLLHVNHLSGSFAIAGAVDGIYAVSLAVGGPLLGRAIDGRGQTRVLIASALVAVLALGAYATLPVGAPLPAMFALAVAVGLSTPPLDASVCAVLARLLDDPATLRAAYAVDATAVELTWISGPPLALLLATAVSTSVALAGAGIVLLLGTLAFAADPVSRSWVPAPTGERKRRAMRSPAMRTLVFALVGMGALTGAVEVGVTAATTALGHPGAAGALFGIWGVGSLVGGLVVARLGGGARTGRGLALVMGGLVAGHLLLIPGSGSVAGMGIALFAGGTAIAPTFASVFGMVDGATPAGTETEAFAWLTTASALGGAAGVAAGGALAQGAGPVAAFVFAAAGGAVAVATVLGRDGFRGPEPAAATPEPDCAAVTA